MLAVREEDRRKLKFAMASYASDIGANDRLENYGDGLMMITDSSRGQGRCLFFTVANVDGEEVLTALLVYKKETQRAPRRLLDTALQRMRSSR